MALSEIDRELLQLCLARKPQAWERFVDRFLGLVVHVVNHSAQSRGIHLAAHDREDLVADVIFTLVDSDFAVLRRFRGESSLATYLTVVARRVVVRALQKLPAASTNGAERASTQGSTEERISDREEVERLLEGLNEREAAAVRLFHLEGKSYGEICAATGIPENSLGATLSRARSKMRYAADSAVK